MDLTDLEDLTTAPSVKQEARDPQNLINVSYSTLWDIALPEDVKNAAQFYVFLKNSNKLDLCLSHALALRTDQKTYPTIVPKYLDVNFRSTAATKISDPHKLHFDDYFNKMFGDGQLVFTRINGVQADIAYFNVEGKMVEYTIQVGLLDKTTSTRAGINMQTYNSDYVQVLLDNTYAKTGDINYYIPTINGDATPQFLAATEKIADIKTYQQLSIASTMKGKFLGGSLKSKNSPAVIRFHQILNQTRKIRGENPQSPERSLYTAYPFLPDTTIAQFGTLVMLEFVKKRLGLSIRYYYDLPFSNSLFTVNGYAAVHLIKDRLDRDDGNVLYIQKTQLNGAALKAFMNMISKDLKRKLVKMYLPSDDWNDFYVFIEKNRLIPIIGEAPHNGILYLATEETDKEYNFPNQLAALNMIMFCGIELNVGRSFNFIKKSKYTDIVTYDRPKYSVVTYINQIMTVIGNFTVKSIGDAVMMEYKGKEKEKKEEDVVMAEKILIGSEEYKKVFKAGMTAEELNFLEFKYDGPINEVFTSALADFAPGDDIAKVKTFLAIVFGVVILGDSLADLTYEGYEKPNKKLKKEGEVENLNN